MVFPQQRTFSVPRNTRTGILYDCPDDLRLLSGTAMTTAGGNLILSWPRSAAFGDEVEGMGVRVEPHEREGEITISLLCIDPSLVDALSLYGVGVEGTLAAPILARCGVGTTPSSSPAPSGLSQL